MNETATTAPAPRARRGRPVKSPPAAEDLPTSPSQEGVASATAASSRADDSLERAAKRAAELREHGEIDDGEDKFYFDTDRIPRGWTYEWKRFTVFGKEDPSYQVQLKRHGWEPVPVDRHPEMMPEGWKGMCIERDGMILMERPAVITEEARLREKRRANQQVSQKEDQLNNAPAPGQFERDNKGHSLVKINKSYEKMPVPKE